MPDEWIVLLEAVGDVRDPIDADDLKKLHEALEPGCSGGVLVARSRYALQVTTCAASVVEALLDVVARWTEAVSRMGFPPWKLVRVEVFTPEELIRDFESAARQESGVDHAEADVGADEFDEMGDELLRRAFSDSLTGLLGAQAFRHGLEAGLVGPPGGRTMAVVCLDLDGFQGVNQAFGDATGDEVLIAVGQRLAAMVRPIDILARLGGDEYGVLLENSGEDAAVAVAGRMLDAVRLPMTGLNENLTLSASAGVAVSQPGDDGRAVLDHAEAALSAAKAAGGGGPPVLFGSDVSHVVQTGQNFATDIAAVQEAEDVMRSHSLRIQAEGDEDDVGKKPPAS